MWGLFQEQGPLFSFSLEGVSLLEGLGPVWLMPTQASLSVPNVWHTTTFVVIKLFATLVARLGKKSCL